MTDPSLVLTQMEELGLIKLCGGLVYILPRNREWLEKGGIIQYKELPTSNIAEAKNRNFGPFGSVILCLERPKATGVEISRSD